MMADIPYEASIDLAHLLAGIHRRTIGAARADSRGLGQWTTRDSDALNASVRTTSGMGAAWSDEMTWQAIRQAVIASEPSPARAAVVSMLGMGASADLSVPERKKAAIGDLGLRGRVAPESIRIKYKHGVPSFDSEALRIMVQFVADVIRGLLDREILHARFDELRLLADRDAAPPDDADASPTETDGVRRLLRHSERFRRELALQIAGADVVGEIDRRADQLYVRRTIQDRLEEELLSPTRPIVISGEAGYGKSSLLWGLASDLIEQDIPVVLVSATWLPGASGSDALFGVPELVATLGELHALRGRLVVLIDTADLLLHSEASIEHTEDLLATLIEHGIAVLATVRPVEAQKLTIAPSHDLELFAYEPAEMDAAATALMARFFPEHEPTEGVELVRQARIRELPVLDICRSPLLLRLLFELAGPVLPSMEIDVTGLYNQYWQRRIESDQRNQTRGQGNDLGPLAKAIGIAMLVEGTPEPETTALQQLIPRIAPTDVSGSVIEGLETLIGRGTMIVGAETTRFFHQTLFEFAAAKGLVSRGGLREAERLFHHMKAHPHDLFVGAVLEQLLILLGETRSGRNEIEEIVHELVRDPNPTISQIGLVVWAHFPGMTVPDTTIISTLPPEALNRFLDTLPQVWGSGADEIVETIRHVWRMNPATSYHAVVRTMARVAHRSPKQISLLTDELNVIGYFLGAGRKAMGNPLDLYRLVFALAGANPIEVREIARRLVREMDFNESRVRLINEIATAWPAIANPEFAAELVEIATRVQAANRDMNARDIRDALGRILFADAQLHNWGHLEWLSFAKRALSKVTSETNTIEGGAALAALAHYLTAVPRREEEIVDLIFSVTVDNGPPQIVGSLIAPVLSTECPAREALIPRMREVLTRGLPSPLNSLNATSDQKWATAIRAALKDDRVPPEVVAAVTNGVLDANRDTWRTLELLVSVISPAAIGGSLRARHVLQELPLSADAMPEHAQRRFLPEAQRFVALDDDVATAYVAVAIRRRATGQLMGVAASDRGRASLTVRAADLHDLVWLLLNGNNQEQGDAANLWKQLQANDVLNPDLASVQEALRITTDPTAKATLLGLVPLIVKNNVEYGAAALATIREYAYSEIRTGRRKGSLQPPAIVDAAFAAWRAILAAHPSLEGWETLKELALQPKLVGDKALDAGQVKDISSYLRNLMGLGNLDGAALCLADAGVSIARTPFSVKQLRKASNILYGAVIDFTQRASSDELLTVMEAVPDFPKVLAETFLRSALRRPDGKSRVESLLAARRLPPSMAEYAGNRLRGHRDFSYEPMPELIHPARSCPRRLTLRTRSG